jgi:hypothetical protein
VLPPQIKGSDSVPERQALRRVAVESFTDLIIPAVIDYGRVWAVFWHIIAATPAAFASTDDVIMALTPAAVATAAYHRVTVPDVLCRAASAAIRKSVFVDGVDVAAHVFQGDDAGAAAKAAASKPVVHAGARVSSAVGGGKRSAGGAATLMASGQQHLDMTAIRAPTTSATLMRGGASAGMSSVDPLRVSKEPLRADRRGSAGVTRAAAAQHVREYKDLLASMLQAQREANDRTLAALALQHHFGSRSVVVDAPASASYNRSGSGGDSDAGGGSIGSVLSPVPLTKLSLPTADQDFSPTRPAAKPVAVTSPPLQRAASRNAVRSQSPSRTLTQHELQQRILGVLGQRLGNSAVMLEDILLALPSSNADTDVIVASISKARYRCVGTLWLARRVGARA